MDDLIHQPKCHIRWQLLGNGALGGSQGAGVKATSDATLSKSLHLLDPQCPHMRSGAKTWFDRRFGSQSAEEIIMRTPKACCRANGIQ